MSEVQLPNQWQARPYQQDLFRYMFTGGLDRKRAACVWHRRAGKDSCCLNLAAVASQMRVGTIWHMLPTLKQGRKVIWDGIDKHGRRMIDQAFPPEMRSGKNDSEMQIRLKNGSIWQVVGSDNYDALVGTNPVGIIMSEYSIADPAAWDYIRPILAENGGWAMFIYTPRGNNHGYKLFDSAKKSQDWFASLLTVDDTHDERGNFIVSPEAIESERMAGYSEEKIQQEFYCSFDGGMEGAFYTNEIKQSRREGRIGIFPHDPAKPCQTFWDIGFRDQTSILITQRGEDGNPIIIDHIIDRNKPLDFYVRELRETGYVFDEHWGPHDFENTDWVTGKTRREMAENLGLKIEIVPKLDLADGIEQARAMIRKCRFNEPKLDKLLDGLRSYRREYDEKMRRFRDKPLHDWASDIADSFRYLSIAWRNDGYTTGGRRIDITKRFKVKRSLGGKRGR